MADEDDRKPVNYWLGQVAHQLRMERERKAVHIASDADVDQSTITRFEKGLGGFATNTNRIIEAYASDLDVDAYMIWQLALELWHQDQTATQTTAPEDVRRLVEEAVERARRRRGSNPEDKPGQRQIG